MKDQRLYAKIALDFPDHPKIAPLSDAAYRALTEMIAYSCRMKTDGFISKRLVGSKGEAGAKWSLQVCSELCANDDEQPSLIEAEPGYLLHDFEEHQLTKADIEARRTVRETAGRRGGIASGRARRSKREANASQSVEANAKQNEADRELELEREVTTTGKPVVVPRKRGTRLSPDWMPSTAVVDIIKTEWPRVDLKAEHAKFVDYWIAKSGKDAAKLDWDATWRNWIRRAAENNHTTNGAARPSTSDRIFAEVQALKDHPSTRLELM